MFDQYDALKREIEALKKEVRTLKDDQIKQNRDYKDAIYNLDSDNLPSLQGIVKKVNLAITEGGKVTAQFIMDVVNGESNAKIKADRLDIEGKKLNIKVDAANITGTLTVKEADGDVLLFSAGDGVVKIGGWNVDNNSLWTGTSFSDEDSIFLSTGSNADLSIAGSPKQSNWVIKAGQNFGVNKEGEVYLSKAYIRRGCVIGEDIEEGNGLQLGPVYDDENATSRTDIYLEQNEDPLSGGYSRGANISSLLIRGENVAIESDHIKAVSGDVVIDPFKLGSSMSTIKVEDNLWKVEKGFVGLERTCTAASASNENMTAIMRVGEHALWINDKGELCTTAKTLLTEREF